MSIPLATTTVTLHTFVDDGWGGATDVLSAAVGDPVRAHFSAPSGQAAQAEGAVAVQYRLVLDPCDLTPAMAVTDVTTGAVYRVDWTLPSAGPHPHRVAGVSAASASP